MNKQELKIKKKRSLKIYKRLIAIILIIILAIIVKKRWHAWFVNKPELSYITPDSIDRVTLTSGEDFLSERTISWRCGEELQEASLDLWDFVDTDTVLLADNLDCKTIEAQGKLIHSRSGKGCFYSVHLDSLQAGHQYVYTIQTGKEQSKVFTFSIPKGLDTLERFLYLGDVQDSNGALSKKLFKNLLPKPSIEQEADTNTLIKAPLHFVATAGDQIEGPCDAYWNIWYQSWGEDYTAQIPFNVATGNHEYQKKGFARELDPRWVVQYNYPKNSVEDFMGRSYYIDYPLMRFIVLDSNGISLPSEIFSHREWLTNLLKSSKQPWQVVMFHHGVKSVREDRLNLIMKYGFKSLLEENGADLVLQGHDHAYSRITTKTNDNKMVTPVYIISTSSPKLYENEFSQVHDRIASGVQLYQIIEMRPQSINYKSYLYNGQLYDELVINKNQEIDGRYIVKDKVESKAEIFNFNNFGQDKKGRQKAQKYQEAIKERKRNKIKE